MMPSSQFNADLFFTRAKQEAQRYGEEPWVFLRELVQNSRDAGASRVGITARKEGDQEIITCRDDGCGMNSRDVEEYLLRLYASNKERAKGTIGYYGVGFWSVLLFEPTVIRVQSAQSGERIAFEVLCLDEPGQLYLGDVGLKTGSRYVLRSIPPLLDRSGTEVTLVRPVGVLPETGEDLAKTVRRWLIHYAGPVRPLNGRCTLGLFCNGEQVNQPLDLPSHLGRSFKTHSFDGVLGFDFYPSVRIYQGGILVRDLSTLEEVIPSRKTRLPPIGGGIYPRVAINADGLKLLMDRHTIQEDPFLYQIVRFCEVELAKLHRRVLQNLFPLDLTNLFHLTWQMVKRHKNLLWGLLGLVFVTLGMWALGVNPGRLLQRENAPPKIEVSSGFPTQARLLWTVDQLTTAQWSCQIDPAKPSSPGWDMSYDGPALVSFHFRTVSRYDPGTGFRFEPPTATEPYPELKVTGQPTITVRLRVSGQTTWVVLPVPLGHMLLRNSLRVEPGGTKPVWLDQYGEPMVEIPFTASVTYQTAASAIQPSPAMPSFDAFDDPGIPAQLIQESLDASPLERVPRLCAWMARHLEYSLAESDLIAFQEASGTWWERTLSAGAGDCDVLNGMLVLLLNRAKIPAYLVIGLIGIKGEIRATSHAWTLYQQEGWHVLDVSQQIPLRHESPPAMQDRGLSVRTEDEKNAEKRILHPSKISLDLTHFPTIAGGALLGLGLLVLSLVLVYLVWFRNRRLPLDEPDFLQQLLTHYYQSGDPEKGPSLKYHPIFPTLDGRRLSLFQIQRQAMRDRLYAATPSCALLPFFNWRGRILDASTELFSRLASFIPPTIRLDKITDVLSPASLPEPAQRMEKQIRRHLPDFRIVWRPGSPELHDLTLAGLSSKFGRYFLFLGGEHPLAKELQRHSLPQDQVQWYLVVEKIIHKLVFCLDSADQFLGRLAEDQLERIDGKGAVPEAGSIQNVDQTGGEP